MRILRVVASMDPRDGGVAEAVRSTTAGLIARGHTVDIVTLDDPEEASAWVWPAPIVALGSWAGRYRYTPQLSQWIRRHGQDYEVGIVEGLWNHASIGGAHGFRAAGIPYAIFPHGMLDPWFRRTFPVKHAFKRLFWWLFQGPAVRGAACVAFTSDEERRRAGLHFGKEGDHDTVVPLGLADVPPPDPAVVAAFRATVPGLRDRPYLLFMSRLHRKKGCNLLINGFAALIDRMPADLDLVIAGPDRDQLQAELQRLPSAITLGSRIHWTGMLTGPSKWGALQGADAFVLPSHQENFGMVVAEAMACGRPVLLTDKVNIWREVEASGACLVAPDTPQGIRDMLVRWLAIDADARAAMGARAREEFLRSFEISATIHTLEAMLLRIGRAAG